MQRKCSIREGCYEHHLPCGLSRFGAFAEEKGSFPYLDRKKYLEGHSSVVFLKMSETVSLKAASQQPPHRHRTDRHDQFARRQCVERT